MIPSLVKLPSLFLCLGLTLVLLTSCGVDHGRGVAQASVVEPAETASGTYVLGTSVTPSGAIAKDAASELFLRGGPVFLSVNVTGATTHQHVEVEWRDHRDHALRRDARDAPPGASHVAFSTGPTASWSAGIYKALVIIDGRRVSELTFSVA